MTMFVLDDVGITIDGRSLLRAISLTVPAGKVTALIGHNGSGKSTLLRLMARLLAPSDGRIALYGKPLGDWQSWPLAREIAYMPQQVPAVPGVTVRELVALGRYPWHGPFGRLTTHDRDKIAAAMAMADVTQLADRFADTLSGGERQRAWLAMLVAQDARCLLLDEPTSALDIAHQVEVLSLVRRLSRELGLAVVTILHDVNMAVHYSDMIVALQSGRLIACGPPSSIMRRDVLSDIYGIGMRVITDPATNEVICMPELMN